MNALTSVSANLAMHALPNALPDALSAAFNIDSRLYRLQGEGAAADLLVESWSQRESLSQPWELQISTLSTNARLDIRALLGQRVTLLTQLADGRTEHPRSGLITSASALASDGGFARYRLTVQPWLALLAYGARSAVWQEKSVVEIIDSVFGAYSQHAAWTWSPCASAHLAQSHQSGHRSYTVQYRETDLAFVSRLLAREGLVYRFEIDAADQDSTPLGHKLVILADTTQTASCPEDATSAASGGIRFHRASSQEHQDAIQALGGLRQLQAAVCVTSVWDYKLKRSAAASVPTAAAFAGPNASRIAQYFPGANYTFADDADAQRAMTMAQQALEARHKTWIGRSTVRTLGAGHQFQLTQSTLDVLASLKSGQDAQDQTRFLVTSVVHAGVNNLPKDVLARITQALQPADRSPPLADWVPPEVAEQARQSGYGNRFEAIRAYVPWRVALHAQDGTPLYPTPRPGGPLTATVVGPGGETSASGAGEIHTDRLGRIRIRFDFQSPQAQTQPANTSNASTWVRVMQRFAGPGMGWQFIPRVGQEVLVDFMDGRIERPVVIAALYNGQGEAGIVPTPGGQGAESDTSALSQSSDHRPGAQGNLIGGGHSPAWHGAGSAAATAGSNGQGNAGALSGIKTQEFAGAGFNQLVFDDSNGQLRIQLATSQHGSQLNMGHLIHQADNHRGSLRGAGFELRTDAYGAIRAGRGLLISTYGPTGTGGTPTGQATAEPALDNAAGIALAAQLKTLGQSLNQAAATHQSTKLAAHIGSQGSGQSGLAPAGAKPEASLAAWHTCLKGMVSDQTFDQAAADASQKNTSTATTTTSEGRVPASTDPVIALQARAGWAATAGQDLHACAGDDITLASGQDSHWATGGAFRLHTGQSIGLLAGAVQAGTGAAGGSGSAPAGTGITLIAAQGDTQIQAQSGPLQIAAKQQLSIQSETANIDWAAAKKITLATAGGASIVIEGGNITVMCPGTITVRAGVKSFSGAAGVNYALPAFEPVSMEMAHSLRFAPIGADGLAEDLGWIGKPFFIKDASGKVLASGSVGEDGKLPRVETQGSEKLTLTIGQDQVQVTEVSKAQTDDDFDDRQENEIEGDPYAERLAATVDDDGQFLESGILAKIMGNSGAADA